jgi:hypothetical protein
MLCEVLVGAAAHAAGHRPRVTHVSEHASGRRTLEVGLAEEQLHHGWAEKLDGRGNRRWGRRSRVCSRQGSSGSVLQDSTL